VKRSIEISPYALVGCAVLTATIAAPAVAGVSSAARSRIVSSRRVDKDIVDVLESHDAITVIAHFTLPNGMRSADVAPGSRERAIAGARDAILAKVPASQVAVRHTYRSLDLMVLDVTTDGILALLDRDEILHIEPDRAAHASSDQALPLMRIPEVQALGWTGAGIRVAVLDTGIDAGHPDLSNDIVDQASASMP